MGHGCPTSMRNETERGNRATVAWSPTRPDGAFLYAKETILDKYSTSRECELRKIEKETNPGIVLLATGRMAL